MRDACAGNMNIMRHCRQCRADAVGLLGEDRCREFTLDKLEHREVDYGKAAAVRRRVHAAIEADRAARLQAPAPG